jgi:hypothetical protein
MPFTCYIFSPRNNRGHTRLSRHRTDGPHSRVRGASAEGYAANRGITLSTGWGRWIRGATLVTVATKETPVEISTFPGGEPRLGGVVPFRRRPRGRGLSPARRGGPVRKRPRRRDLTGGLGEAVPFGGGGVARGLSRGLVCSRGGESRCKTPERLRLRGTRWTSLVSPGVRCMPCFSCHHTRRRVRGETPPGGGGG